MAHPKLARASSGYQGRGYVRIFEEKPDVVPSITTALGHMDRPGLIQWSVDQTAAYAAKHAAQLLDRDVEQAFGYTRFYHSRLNSTRVDDPMNDLRNAHSGVLNDLAELGTFIHEWIEADLLGDWEPEIQTETQEQLVNAYLEWKFDQDIEVTAVEFTAFGTSKFGQHYGGTGDTAWKLNGVNMLNDNKTSRKTRREHVAQLAALANCDTMAVEVSEGTEGAVKHESTVAGKKQRSWWVPAPMPTFEGYSVLQIRPDDFDNEGNFISSFAKIHHISQARIDAGLELFNSALAVTYALKAMKAVEKEEGIK